MSKKEYQVGFGKPPQSSRFKRGKSGNPRGRPKGTRNLATDLKGEMGSKILVNEGGKSQKITKQMALVKTLSTKALKGDVRAMNTLLKLIDQNLFEEPDEIEEPKMSQEDEEILKSFLKKHSTDNSQDE